MGTSSNSNVSTATSTQFSFRDQDFAVHRGSLCVDSDGTGCPVNPTAGRAYSDNTALLTDDLAELMRSSEQLSPGDIVTVDPDFKNEDERTYEQERRSDGLGTKKGLDELGVKKTTEKFQKAIVGIISTKPGIILGGFEPTKQDFEVALTGRVPVKVSTEAGSIEVGDYITSSSLAGVGMKADQSGNAVGIALEAFDGNDVATTTFVNGKPVKETKILVLIDLGYSRLDSQISGGQIAGADEGWVIDQETGRITTALTLDMAGRDIINVRNILGTEGRWSINENGVLETKEVRTDKLCIGGTCVDEGQLRALLNGSPAPAPSQPSSAEASEGKPENNDNEEEDNPEPEPEPSSAEKPEQEFPPAESDPPPSSAPPPGASEDKPDESSPPAETETPTPEPQPTPEPSSTAEAPQPEQAST